MCDSDNEDNGLKETLEFLSQQLEEHYHLKTTNMYGGQGGFGLVMFVYDINDESKKYAIKAQSIINPNNGSINQNLMKQCKEEARVMRECKHKNIVEIHADFVLGFYHFIQMNLCQCSLNDWIQMNGNNPVSDLVFLHYVNQIIDGLEYLHNLDYVLRDVSVRNILLTTEGVLKLCDFGLAKKYDNTLRSKVLYTSHIQGVIYYFPPEINQSIQENKSQIKQTKEGDIWALGVCLSLLGGIPIGHFSNSQHKDFEIIDAPNLSEKANQLIKHILIKNPQDRPTFKQIRENIQTIFFSSDFVKIDLTQLKNKSKQNSKNTANSFDNTKSTALSLQTESQQQTAVMFIDNQQIAKNIQDSKQDSFDKSITESENENIEFNFMNGDNLTQKYSSILQKQPDNIRALLMLGHIEISLYSNFETGYNYLEKVVSIQQTNIDSYLGICESFLLQFQVKNYSKLIEYTDYCFKMNQNHWRVHYIQAWILYVQQKYTESEQKIQQAISIKPNSSVIMSLQALILAKTSISKLEFCKNLLENALSLNVQNDPIVLSRAGLFYQTHLKQPNQAINFSLRALNISDKNLMALSNLVIAHNQLNNKNDLEEYKKKILQSYSNNSYVNEILGDIEGNIDQKINYYNKAIECDKKSINPYFQISEIKKSQCKIDEAEEIYRKVLEINPDDALVYIELGNIYAIQGDNSKAVSFYKMAQERLIDKQEISKYVQGQIYELYDEEYKAVQFYKDSYKINPQYLKAYKRALMILEKDRNSNIQALIEINNQAIASNPQCEEFIENLISLYIENKEFKNAIGQLKELLMINSKRIGINEKIAQIEQKELKKPEKALHYYKKEIEIQNSEQALLNIAIILTESKNYDEAARCLETAQNLYPYSFNVIYQQGILMVQLKYFDRAIQMFEQILQMNPSHGQSQLQLGLIYQAYKNDCQKALEYYQKGLSTNQVDYIVYYNMGLIYSKENKFDRAIEFLKKYYEFNDKDYKTTYELGSVYLRQKDTQNALHFLTKTVQLNPDFDEGWYLLSQAQRSEQRIKEAIDSLNRLRALNPNKLDALMDLANLELQNNSKIAIQLYKQVLLKEPLNKDAILILSRQDITFKSEIQKNFNQEKDQEKQVIYLKQRLIIEPKSFGLIRTLGLLYTKMERKEEALETFQKLLFINPNYSNTYYNIGYVYQQLYKNNDQALEYYQKADKNGEDSSQFYTQLGLIYIDQKSFGKAIDYLKKASRRRPIYAQAYYYLGWIYSNEYKDYKKAIKFYGKCINEINDEPKVYFGLGKAFEELNYIYKAKESYEKVLSLNPNFEKSQYIQEFIASNPTPEYIEYKEKCSIF